jgi:hypothetical protein
VGRLRQAGQQAAASRAAAALLALSLSGGGGAIYQLAMHFRGLPGCGLGEGLSRLRFLWLCAGFYPSIFAIGIRLSPGKGGGGGVCSPVCLRGVCGAIDDGPGCGACDATTVTRDVRMSGVRQHDSFGLRHRGPQVELFPFDSRPVPRCTSATRIQQSMGAYPKP